MFKDLDATLQAMMDDAAAPSAVSRAEVSFETPDRDYAPANPSLNLFLHGSLENRELRDPEPVLVFRDGMLFNRPPPIRIDCGYLVTAWSDKQGALKVAEEHEMLGDALAWLSGFGTVPDAYLRGALVGQAFPPPTLVAQFDGIHRSNEFWSALGIPPRLSFGLTVTIAMDLEGERTLGPPVVTHALSLEAASKTGAPAHRFSIAGVVRAADSDALIADADVRIDELQQSTRTDSLGRYRFSGLRQGAYTVSARAGGFQPTDRSIEVPGDAPDAYGIELSVA